MSFTREDVVAVLRTIRNPATGSDLVASDAVRALAVEDGRIRFVIEVDPAIGRAMEPARLEVVRALERLAGPGNVSAILTAHSAPRPPDLKAGRHPPAQKGPQKLPGIGAVIAVASGKGGVGKSTVSANLACALAAEGRRAGLLDADIHGPSQPRMMGVAGRPARSEGNEILPLHAHGVAMMSIGALMREDEAVIWRGPMLMGALQQLLGQVRWGALDVLVVDLPPGTGDVQLSLAQKAELAGVVIVSTPQDVALLDARKALDMCGKLGTRVLGMVENMSSYVCPECGHEAHIFGHGGARAEAARLGLPFLGEIPLDLSIRLAGDAGAPVVVSDPGGAQARAFRAVARRLIADGVV